MSRQAPGEIDSSTSRRMEIRLVPRRIEGGYVRHGCVIRRIDGSTESDTDLWYEVPADLPQIASDDAEPFLLASLMDAMMEDRNLHVAGRVGFQLLSNLQEAMAAWSRWVPGTLRVVELTADTVTTEPEPSDLPHDSAVTAHTGGIDAMSTILRHVRALEGSRTRRIKACVVVHGFLIALDRQEKFQRSLELAQSSLDPFGITAHPLRTNLRDAIRANWLHVYGIAMVSVLQFFKPLGRSCLVNAPKPYDDLIFPRGSNPITDPLFSSESMQVLHDGACHSRLEKIAQIAGWAEGTRDLRVCWHGDQIEANCGLCEECVRTKLGFLALGLPYPESLGSPPTVRQILELDTMGSASRADFLQILTHCQNKSFHPPWVRALKIRLRFDPAFRKIRHWKWVLSRRRRFA